MKRYEIQEKMVWLNMDTGQRASPFGAVPHGAGDWQLVTDGATLHDRRTGTYHSRHGDTEQSIAERMGKAFPNWREMEA
jgi:hypothetical protein